MTENWKCPTEYPNLKNAEMISIDTETYDPDLEENGPGGVRKNGGYIVGFSIAVDEYKAYYPLKHKGGDNVDNPENCLSWLKDQLSNENQPKIGANILYDLEWLRVSGVEVKGKKYDIQVAEPLLDEDKKTYKLDALAEFYFGEHKDTELMTLACEQFLGINDLKKMMKNIWRLPARFVGPYGEKDADLPLRIFKEQKKKLHEENLWRVFELETGLTDLLLEMRFQGVPIDLEKAERIRKDLDVEYNDTMKSITRYCGFRPNIWAAEDIAKACDILGLEYNKTEKGNCSFDAAWLNSQTHRFFEKLLYARKLDRGGGVFIQKKIIDLQVNGRIYPSFWQVKNDYYGTASGRFSSSNPNMQQVPSRDKYLSPLIRGIFIPEVNCQWGVFDYSQQEPRVTVHYANLCGFRGASEAAKQFNDDPDTDYHQMTADMANIDRKPAKSINLGLAYGMGAEKMAGQLNVSLEEANRIRGIYFDKVPFIKKLGDYCTSVASKRGYIKTLAGRRRRFNLFGPPKWSRGIVPKRYEEAVKEFGLPLKRYFVHKAMNALIQGSSADMIKYAMRDCYTAGYIPHMTIHDELDFSIENEKQAKDIRDIMLNCVKLTVPMKVDIEFGNSWGECTEVRI